MKIKDVKHDHSLTDLLKVSIFSLLMLAPMINVGVRCAYVTCNKNAYQSASMVNEIQATTEYPLVVGNTYTLITDYNTTSRGNFDMYVENLTSNYYVDLTTTNKIYMNNNTYQFFDSSNNELARIITYNDRANNNINIEFTFIYKGTPQNIDMYKYVFISKQQLTLDNVFEYSVNQLTESPLYNWVENTAIYSGVALMNTQLGITQPVISLLVVYWLLLTIIYVIIDIVIRVFTWLTHMIGSKTA